MCMILIECLYLAFYVIVYIMPALSWFISAVISALICIQLFVWWGAIGELVKGEADREDALCIIPMFWVIPFVVLLWREVPKAMKRKPRR